MPEQFTPHIEQFYDDAEPLLQTVQQLAGVDTIQVLESIKRQLKFLQRPENQNLPVAPAQMINQDG